MIEWGSCVGNIFYFYDLDKVDSWDIDDQADFLGIFVSLFTVKD